MIPTVSLTSRSIIGMVEGIFEFSDTVIIRTPVEKIVISKEDYINEKVSLSSIPQSNILMVSLKDRVVVLMYNELSITIKK